MHNEPCPSHDEQHLNGDLALWLSRVDAPPGFTARVLDAVERSRALDQHLCRESNRSQAGRQERESWSVYFTRGRLPVLTRRLALAVAVLLILLTPLAERLYRQHRQARAEAAAQQFSLAMRLTRETFQDAIQEGLQDAEQQEVTHHRARDTQ